MVGMYEPCVAPDRWVLSLCFSRVGSALDPAEATKQTWLANFILYRAYRNRHLGTDSICSAASIEDKPEVVSMEFLTTSSPYQTTTGSRLPRFSMNSLTRAASQVVIAPSQAAKGNEPAL